MAVMLLRNHHTGPRVRKRQLLRDPTRNTAFLDATSGRESVNQQVPRVISHGRECQGRPTWIGKDTCNSEDNTEESSRTGCPLSLLIEQLGRWGSQSSDGTA